MTEARFTVFVRVPVPRGDFVDPPPVEWDSSKDQALWKVLSEASSTEIDWNQVADQYQVPVDFLLQQVAYVTERHAQQVRAQVRKASAAAKVGSAAPSPVPGPDSSHQRSSSARLVTRERGPVQHDGSGSGTPVASVIRPLISRNASTSTAIFRDAGATSSRAGDYQPSPTQAVSTPTEQPPSRPRSSSKNVERLSSPGPAESTETSSSSEDGSSPAQSRIIRRPPRFQQVGDNTTSAKLAEDDDDDSEPAFQPVHASGAGTSAHDLSSTLKGSNQFSSRQARKQQQKSKQRHDKAYHSQTSDDSNGSAAMVAYPGSTSRPAKPLGPLSPRRRAELAGRSPGGKGKGLSREGSEGTPSMGSSFSDLDDTSVTQSALEEALASHMSGAGSRFSISQAFRSRYYPSGK